MLLRKAISVQTEELTKSLIESHGRTPESGRQMQPESRLKLKQLELGASDSRLFFTELRGAE